MNEAKLLARLMEFGIKMGTVTREDILLYIFRNTGLELEEIMVMPAGDIPMKHDDANSIFYEHAHPQYAHIQVLDFKFKDGRLPFKKSYKPVFAEAQRLGYHLHNFAVMDGTYYFRMFKTDEFHCSGHPEMLLGQPLGQYRCEVCYEMQCAGTMHLPREFADE